MKRPTQWCDSCESTVYTDDVHSCYDAKAVREQQERESALTTAERERDRAERAERVVEAAEAWEFSFRDPADPMGYEVDDKHDALLAAVRRYREGTT
jgi:hypothetical protein